MSYPLLSTNQIKTQVRYERTKREKEEGLLSRTEEDLQEAQAEVALVSTLWIQPAVAEPVAYPSFPSLFLIFEWQVRSEMAKRDTERRAKDLELHRTEQQLRSAQAPCPP